MVYYFAYGSCMSARDFKRTMKTEKGLLKYEDHGMGILRGYKLGFNAYSKVRQGGVLDIEQCEGCQVTGVLYRLSDEALREVDRREGSKYMRIPVMVESADELMGGELVEAYTYSIVDKISTKANRKYAAIGYTAMVERGFPEEAREAYAKIVRESIFGSEENYLKAKNKKNS